MLLQNRECRQKIGNCLAYIVFCDPKIGRTRLVKALYFADLVSFNLSDRFVTDDTYLVQLFGPMGDIAGELTQSTNEYIRALPKTNEYELREYQSLIQTPNIDAYSETEKATIEANWRWVTQHTTEEIKNLTHTFRMWKENAPLQPIPQAEFLLNSEEIKNLDAAGIQITGFGKHCSSIARNLPIYYNSLTEEDREALFTDLIRKFPIDVWSEYDDCFLAGIDAIREVTQLDNTQPLLSKVCDYAGAMAVSLAYAQAQPAWTAETLAKYTSFFDTTAFDVVGACEKCSDDTVNAVDELMSTLREKALLCRK